MIPKTQKGKEKSLDMTFLKKFPINTDTLPVQEGRRIKGMSECLKNYPYTHGRNSISGRTNYAVIPEIQYIPLKFGQEEVQKLKEKNPHYAKLIENIKLKNEGSKGDYSLDPHGALYKKIKDHR